MACGGFLAISSSAGYSTLFELVNLLRAVELESRARTELWIEENQAHKRNVPDEPRAMLSL